MASKLFRGVVFENDVYQCNRILTINWLIFFLIEASFFTQSEAKTPSVWNRNSKSKVLPRDKTRISMRIFGFSDIFGWTLKDLSGRKVLQYSRMPQGP